MIKITNGTVICEVTNGAYEKIYKSQGYRPFEDTSAVQVVVDIDDGANLSNRFAELIEKPISQWSKAEVKAFAEARNVDLSGTKNVGEAKERIKAYLETAV